MFGLGPQEFIIVAIIFIVLFGGARLPSLMRNMGRSINEFKAGMKDKPADPPSDPIEDARSAPRMGMDSEKEEKETV